MLCDQLSKKKKTCCFDAPNMDPTVIPGHEINRSFLRLICSECRRCGEGKSYCRKLLPQSGAVAVGKGQKTQSSLALIVLQEGCGIVWNFGLEKPLTNGSSAWCTILVGA